MSLLDTHLEDGIAVLTLNDPARRNAFTLDLVSAIVGVILRGFDNNILACIDLADGKRKWKGGRYGNGQMILLADQDLLIVTSEEGELALVSATTDQYKELAKIPLFDAKTWNHPVVVGNVLLVRNGEEMAAFRLAADAAHPTDAAKEER